MAYPLSATKIVNSTLGFDAGAIGAAGPVLTPDGERHAGSLHVVDQSELDLTEGAQPAGPAGTGPLEGDDPRPGHPATATPSGTPGEVASRGGATPAGPSSPTSGTGAGTGARRPEEGVPPTAPG